MEAFFGTVCLIAVHRSDSGRTGCHRCGRVDILSCVVGKTEHHVKNSKHLAQTLADITLDDDEILNSHAVVSLFTNTPINKSLEVIKERLTTDNSWNDKTRQDFWWRISWNFWNSSSQRPILCSATRFGIQKFGTAMGSPVSPMVADIFMEFLEQSAIASVPVECKPKLWKRYVDDTIR